MIKKIFSILLVLLITTSAQAASKLDAIKKRRNENTFQNMFIVHPRIYFSDKRNEKEQNIVGSLLKRLISSNKIHFNDIKIKLLCYPRIFGYVFNPLSIFYIYDSKNKLITVIYEVKNTFGEQHTYVFKIEGQSKLIQNNCSKKFHVSPFIEMHCNYFFRILNPGENLSVKIDQYDQEGKILFASQDGKRSDLTSKNLMNSYLKHPLMTFKIIAAIHFEAFKLWIKGIKFVKKKLKIKNNITIEN